MEKIVILPALENKLFDLIFTLYNKEYFGFVESAIAYVDNIIDFIYTIPNRKHKKQKIANTGLITVAINLIRLPHGLSVLILKMKFI